MAKSTENENWVHPNSIEDEDQEEALSLCDLPTNEEQQSRTESSQAQPQIIQVQEDFDFGSWSSNSLLTQPEMCAADDVFFQGQILPLRHSISSASDVGLTKFRQDSSSNINGRVISRSMSMDHKHFSASGFSSRSSSISSGSVSTTKGFNYKPKVRNQFHSHPSPNPQIRIPIKNPAHVTSRKSSTMWRFFQVGLLKTPEIELIDLKIRNKKNTIHPFGSRNSNSSLSTSTSSFANQENNKTGKKKKKIHGGLFGISCKCSVDAIETVPLNLIIIKNINEEKEELLGRKKKKNQGKQAMSRHRTFEWLKQLSLQEGGANSDQV